MIISATIAIPTKNIHRFTEWQKNLTSHCMEKISRCCEVAHKPVDFMELLHFKVLILRLKEKKQQMINNGQTQS
jgi:hypothetical protein